MNLRLSAANMNEEPAVASYRPAALGSRLLDWLTSLAHSGLAPDWNDLPSSSGEEGKSVSAPKDNRTSDWNIVEHICGYSRQDFTESETALPLTAAEIEYFRRNHRGIENHISQDFLTAQIDLPSPLSEFYGLYRHRARADTEAALFLAQSTSSVRVARTMADLLAIGAFANGMERISYLGSTYSVPCAFDTSAEIDRANAEASRRLALPIDHPSHLLKLATDEVGVLAASIVEGSALSPEDFLEKARVLSEARQDVNRLPRKMQFSTALNERDLPAQSQWVDRLETAYSRIFTRT